MKHVYRRAQKILDLIYIYIINAITYAIIIASICAALMLWITRGKGMFSSLCSATIACTTKPYRVESNPDITGIRVSSSQDPL